MQGQQSTLAAGDASTCGMGENIDGKAIAKKVRAEVRDRAEAFAERYGRQPGLEVVLVGDDPASQVYVRNKERAAKVARQDMAAREIQTWARTIARHWKLQQAVLAKAEAEREGAAAKIQAAMKHQRLDPVLWGPGLLCLKTLSLKYC